MPRSFTYREWPTLGPMSGVASPPGRTDMRSGQPGGGVDINLPHGGPMVRIQFPPAESHQRTIARSTANHTGGERYALAFFCDAHIDWPIAAVPTCVGPGRPPRSETAGAKTLMMTATRTGSCANAAVAAWLSERQPY